MTPRDAPRGDLLMSFYTKNWSLRDLLKITRPMPPKIAKQQQRARSSREADVRKRKASGINKQGQRRQPIAPALLATTKENGDCPEHRRTRGQTNGREAGRIHTSVLQRHAAKN